MKIITIARKPLSESNVASNVLKHGCGAIDIDSCRIATEDNLNGGAYTKGAKERHDGAENWRFKRGEHGNAGAYTQPKGRWPSNLLIFDSSEAETSFPSTSPSKSGDRGAGLRGHGRYGQSDQTYNNHSTVSDSGGSSARFFKQFKVDK